MIDLPNGRRGGKTLSTCHITDERYAEFCAWHDERVAREHRSFMRWATVLGVLVTSAIGAMVAIGITSC